MQLGLPSWQYVPSSAWNGLYVVALGEHAARVLAGEEQLAAVVEEVAHGVLRVDRHLRDARAAGRVGLARDVVVARVPDDVRVVGEDPERVRARGGRARRRRRRRRLTPAASSAARVVLAGTSVRRAAPALGCTPDQSSLARISTGLLDSTAAAYVKCADALPPAVNHTSTESPGFVPTTTPRTRW